MLHRSLALAIVVLLSTTAAHAQDSAKRTNAAAAKCAVEADASWTPQEKFVWTRACAGQTADLNEEYGEVLDPKGTAGFPENRELRSQFIARILRDKAYGGALARKGVRVVGCRFSEELDLEDTPLDHELWLEKCLFLKGIDLSGVRSNYDISFAGSNIIGTLNLTELHLDATLGLHDGVAVGKIVLQKAFIGQALEMTALAAADDVTMDNIQIGADLVLGGAHVKGSVSLMGARVGGVVNLRKTTIDKALVLDSANLNLHLLMDEGTFRGKMTLNTARIGGQLSLGKATVIDALSADNLFVGQQMFVDGSFAGVNLANSIIKGNLQLGPGTFGDNLNLTRVKIDGAVILDAGTTLNTVSFSNLSFSGADLGRMPWETLAKDPTFNPGIYDKVAKAYADVGETDIARSIMMAKINIEYGRQDWLQKKILYGYWLLGGYGYYPQIGFLWILGFVIVGGVVFWRGREHAVGTERPVNLLGWWVFSLDAVIPGINLDKKYDEVRFTGGYQVLLWFLRLLGAAVVVIILSWLKQSVAG